MRALNSFRIFREEDAGGAGGGAGAPDAGQGGSGSLLAGQGAQGGAGAGDAGTQHSFFKGLYDESGKINKGNFDALPDHLKPYRATFEKYDDVPSLLGGLGNLATLAGKKGLQPLPEGADEKSVNEFNERLKDILQIPKDPKGYGLQRPEGIPDHLWDQGAVDQAAELFQKLNVPPAAAKELVKWDAQRALDLEAEQAKAQAAHIEKQKSMLNDAFGAESERKLAVARMTAQKLGLDPQDPIIGNSAPLIIALARAAAMIGESRLVDDGRSGQAGMTHREQALAISTDPANPKYKIYHDRNHPQHKSVVDEVTELNRLALR